MFQTYLEVVNYLLLTYVTDDIVAGANIFSSGLFQTSTLSETKCIDTFVIVSLLCVEVYFESVLKEIFIDGHQKSIFYCIGS